MSLAAISPCKQQHKTQRKLGFEDLRNTHSQIPVNFDSYFLGGKVDLFIYPSAMNLARRAVCFDVFDQIIRSGKLHSFHF